MIEIKIDENGASVKAQGKSIDIVCQSGGLIVEAFRLVKRTDAKMYEKFKLLIVQHLLTGVIESYVNSDVEKETNITAVNSDELLRQYREQQIEE